MLVDNDTFLTELTKLFDSSKEKGTIWLTHKRLVYGEDGPAPTSTPGDGDTQEYPILLRATDGGKGKLSTRITAAQLPKFHSAYGTLLKGALAHTLRKRDKKREQQRKDQSQRRRKRLTESILVVPGISASASYPSSSSASASAIGVLGGVGDSAKQVVVDGPKRGSGRRKRTRKIKAALKQVGARKAFVQREEERERKRKEREELGV